MTVFDDDDFINLRLAFPEIESMLIIIYTSLPILSGILFSSS